MYIKELTLKGFRNYSEEHFTFQNGINILLGSNAQGKTNTAEAIFFLCTGYSPRAHKDRIFIKNGYDEAEIKGISHSNYGDVSVRIHFNSSDNKSVYINGLQIHRIGELMGNMRSVFFNPSELKLVQESPEDRRRFLNISLSQMSKHYFYALSRYNKILLQRNNLLKKTDYQIIKDTLPVWDAQLTKQASIIISARNEFLKTLSPLAEQKHSFLSDGKEELTMKTESGYYGSLEDISYSLFQDLKSLYEKDIKLGYTSIGPHRDDIKFLLNGEDVRTYGSQGQQRTVALSVKLAETELFKDKFGEYPILILDDVLSELDRKRQKRLVEAVGSIQTIFTATHIERSVFKDKLINKITIENGKIKNSKRL